ncbi:ShlB/FhaC/HecB family hemolysin secretion/activation protein [Qipengyuania sp. ASV99]|uniref:ShlB/FhaC/HecB family hemolysin secretion/activation protein n=1 Tax=Qipengyuania sp. ASV99 TaxID=3399681 RepID=UPI003A4C641C
MQSRLNLLALCLAISQGSAAGAQDALDQTDPSQEEERRTEFAPAPQSVRIEFEPVLSTPSIRTEQARIDVGAIVIDGLIAMERSEFAPVLNDYMGRTLESSDLAQLTDSIAGLARARGYLFANAWIAPQPLVAGTLRVQVDEGVIDEIRVLGSQDPAIPRMLEPLRNGRPVSIAALERQVLLADDLPGVHLRGTRFEREGDSGVLIVEASRQDWVGRASFATDGTRPVGPERARIDVDANGLLFDSDGVDFSFTVTPFEPDELIFFSTRYSVVLGSAGTLLSVFGSYSKTEPGAYLSDNEILGESWRAGVRVRHPVIRRRSGGLWLEGSAEVQDLSQDRFGALARHDRISVARLGAYGFLDMGDKGIGGVLRSRLTISQGLDLFGATHLGDALASRLDAPVDFTTVDWWIGYSRNLGSGISLSLDAAAQLATTPVLVGEDIGLGGNFYLRGYDFSTRTGDKGIMGVGELRYDLPGALGPLEQVQLYAFADGGVVGNLADGTGGGSLASSGGGLRADITNRLDFGVEVAVPLTGPRYDTDDESPRINLRVSQSF